MGDLIARNLLAAGFDVRAWNRSPAKLEILAAGGGRIAGDPREAVANARVVITMLADGRALEETMVDPGGALAAIPPGAAWIQMATIGPGWTGRFAGLAERHGVHLIDAPVSGSDGPAARGALVVLAHRDDDVASVVDGLTRPAPPSDAQVATARLPRQRFGDPVAPCDRSPLGRTPQP